ncbi:MAG: N-acetyl-gamma-glutamyl-phosphate reductase [Thermodesulfobacteria bacterium]|nr:N-acetyl-gamma-glutamyl-phosphate reductase [Thermodesulfobacteriota bacterium]
MIKVGIVGATGYTGLELLRILENHPEVEVKFITSRKEAGKTLGELFGWTGRFSSLVFQEPNLESLPSEVDAVFLCLPSGEAQEFASAFLKKNVKVIDLSADFRFKNVKTYEETYKKKHAYPELCEEAVYGLCEVFEEEIKKAKLIANPGCYPTSILLPLIPLIKNKLILKDSIIADSKSGTSGAGRKSDNYFSFCEVNEDFKAYKIASHRHTPEMEEKLSLFCKSEVKLVFTPHLLPINRGIFSTIYFKPTTDINEVYECLKEFYTNKPFVKVCAPGKIPRIAEVRGTNLCKMSVFKDEKRGWGIITSVIDNLVKGASGQAVQNLNLMFGLPEETGLLSSQLFV